MRIALNDKFSCKFENTVKKNISNIEGVLLSSVGPQSFEKGKKGKCKRVMLGLWSSN